MKAVPVTKLDWSKCKKGPQQHFPPTEAQIALAQTLTGSSRKYLLTMTSREVSRLIAANKGLDHGNPPWVTERQADYLSKLTDMPRRKFLLFSRQEASLLIDKLTSASEKEHDLIVAELHAMKDTTLV